MPASQPATPSPVECMWTSGSRRPEINLGINAPTPRGPLHAREEAPAGFRPDASEVCALKVWLRSLGCKAEFQGNWR